MHVMIIKLLAKKIYHEFLKMTHKSKDNRSRVVSRVYHFYVIMNGSSPNGC
jgi:hypothetical protein